MHPDFFETFPPRVSKFVSGFFFFLLLLLPLLRFSLLFLLLLFFHSCQSPVCFFSFLNVYACLSVFACLFLSFIHSFLSSSCLFFFCFYCCCSSCSCSSSSSPSSSPPPPHLLLHHHLSLTTLPRFLLLALLLQCYQACSSFSRIKKHPPKSLFAEAVQPGPSAQSRLDALLTGREQTSRSEDVYVKASEVGNDVESDAGSFDSQIRYTVCKPKG